MSADPVVWLVACPMKIFADFSPCKGGHKPENTAPASFASSSKPSSSPLEKTRLAGIRLGAGFLVALSNSRLKVGDTVTLISASYIWSSRRTVVISIGSSRGKGVAGCTAGGGAIGEDERLKKDDDKNEVNALLDLAIEGMDAGKGGGLKPVASAMSP